MSNDIAISVGKVSKSFKLPHEKSGSLKGALVGWRKRKRGYEMQHVLREVSFDIKKGEFFGIVGRNGSGKSTLLKLISQIYTPDKGSVVVNGKLTPFIELGVGFNPELSGRDNVYLNGALLGFSREEMIAMYDEIVAFAELERFMDQKLKNYSSGMQVRLAFSIAIRANSDILVLDEVLAVGDEAFQRKCYSYFDQLRREHKTVVLVTHDMSAVERFCSRAMFVEDGIIQLVGKPHKVAAEYSRSNERSYNKATHKSPKIQQDDLVVELLDNTGTPTTDFNYGDTMTVRLEWTDERVKNAGVAIFHDNGEYVFGPNTYQDGYNIPKTGTLAYEVTLNLNEGDYFLKIGTTGASDQDTVTFLEEGPRFSVRRDTKHGRWGGITKLDYKWQ